MTSTLVFSSTSCVRDTGGELGVMLGALSGQWWAAASEGGNASQTPIV